MAFDDFEYDPQVRAMQGMLRQNPLAPRLPEVNLPGFLQRIPFLGSHLQGLTDSYNENRQGIGGRIGSALLSAAMVPGPSGPEGAGGGISRALQGVLGGGQFMMQRGMQAAMLPYQMMMPRLQAANIAAQIQERQSEIPYRRAMANRAEAQSDWYMHRMANDDVRAQAYANRPTEAEMEERIAFGMNPPKDPKNITPEEYQQIATNLGNIRNHKAGGGRSATLMDLVEGAYGPPADPKKGYSQKEYSEIAESYTNLQAQAAGIRTGKETKERTDITNPQERTKEFIRNEQKGLYTDVGKQPETDFMKWYTNQAAEGVGYKDMQTAHASFLAEHNKFFEDKANREEDFAKWQNSGAPEQGVGFREWRRTKSATPATSSGGSKPPGW